MSQQPKITPEMTVREVIVTYPGAEQIFEKHGLAGCGGPQGPVEPVGFFARVHGADAEALLRELNQYASGQQPVPAAPPTEAAKDPEIFRVFLKTAVVVALTAGATLGALALAAMALGRSVQSLWPAVTQVHGTAQIFGWVGLFIMGVAYHVLPRLKATELKGPRLARASYWFVLASIVLRLASALDTGVGPTLALASGIPLLVAASMFLWVATRTVTSSQQPTAFWEKYVLASVVWFWLVAAFTLGIGVSLWQQGTVVVPAVIDQSYLQVGLFGFIIMMILGITLRTIPAFMGLRQSNARAFDAIFWALNLGIGASAVAAYLVQVSDAAYARTLLISSALLQFSAVVGYVYFLNLFRRPVMDVGPGVDRSFEKFIKAAYAWFLAAIAMATAYALYQGIAGQPVAHSLVGAYRHALTVGFISIMILGMAYRIVPVFVGARVYSPALLLGSFVFINVGNTMRVLSQPLADLVGGPFFGLMGVSGFIEVAALGLFGYNIWRTMDRAAPLVEAAPGTGTVTAHTLVSDALARVPGALEVFLKYGFTPLKNPVARRVLPQMVTIEQAGRLYPVNVEQLLRDLNSRLPQASGNGHHGEEVAMIVEKTHTVAQVLERCPAALDVFLKHGFEPLRDETLRRAVAGTVTIEIASRMHPTNLEQLLKDLNAVCGVAQAAEAPGRTREVAVAADGKVITLDVRDMPPWERHPKIFETFDSMNPGDTLQLVNDHDPRPLHYQFMMERTDQFQWHSEEKGPRHWVATIKKLASGSGVG